MSYLNLPRLYFSGTFIANPSTVNNTPSNYGPNFPRPIPSWNPDGNGYWMIDCKVTGVVYQDGSSATSPSQDPVIGQPLKSYDYPWPGKIVDLDPQQQMVSEIWGTQILLGQKGAANSFLGKYKVAPFINLWGKCPSQPRMAGLGAIYQSGLENVAWNGTVNSKFLQ